MAKPPRRHRPRRKDSFLGLHLDLHPHDKDTELGRHVTPAMVRRLIASARPDYIQYDCKGHVGFLGYPDSKVSTVAGGEGGAGIINDSLAIYRRVTAAAGVALYVHFSGVWDGVAGKDHPQWLALAPDGKPYDKGIGFTSVFSDYTLERMIPQMKEVLERYDVDGFWVDGDAWAVKLDYSPATVALFEARTGIPQAPTQRGEKGWVQWCNLHRERFFENLRLYMDALHHQSPGPRGVQVASNWLYTPICPEPVQWPVDFISGDYTPGDALNSARWNGRYLANVGLPWDLMAWAFMTNGDQGQQYKPAVQLQQEAAAILAMGGGFQMYFHPDRHGGLAPWHMQVVKEVADFCHARRDICHRSDPWPQVALLLDTVSLFKTSTNVYQPAAEDYAACQGMLYGMLEAGHSVDVLADHQLVEQLDRWPLIVVPEWEYLAPGLVRELLDYVRRGGNLLVTGGKTVGLFGEDLGVEFDGPAIQEKRNFQGAAVSAPGNPPPSAKGWWQKVQPRRGREGAKVLATATLNMMPDDSAIPAATLATLGRGKIAAVYGPLGWCSFYNHAPWSRDLIALLLDQLYTPLASLDFNLPAAQAPRTAAANRSYAHSASAGTAPAPASCRGLIDLAVRVKNERLVIHLCNTIQQRYASPHYLTNDTIPPLGPLTLSLRLSQRPKSITLEPQGQKLAFSWKPGLATLRIPQLHIHAAVAVE